MRTRPGARLPDKPLAHAPQSGGPAGRLSLVACRVGEEPHLGMPGTYPPPPEKTGEPDGRSDDAACEARGRIRPPVPVRYVVRRPVGLRRGPVRQEALVATRSAPILLRFPLDGFAGAEA